jgi:hypothetical protein
MVVGGCLFDVDAVRTPRTPHPSSKIIPRNSEIEPFGITCGRDVWNIERRVKKFAPIQ